MGNSVPSKLVADVVPVNSETTFFPGAHNAYNAKFCLCTSGGGARAMTHTMGVYRALHEMGILEEVDGISSVSGGTWASSIYMFGKDFEGKAIDTATMLGPRSSPQQLTMEVLRQEAPPLARGLTKGNSSELFKQHTITRRDNEVWAHVVADMLLEPFGLASFDCAVAQSEEDVERIKEWNGGTAEREENPEIKTWSFKTPRTDRPKLFVMNGALLAPDDHSITEDNVVSFQMSPDYTGSPFYPKEIMQWVSVPAPASIFSLPKMVGISSFAPASAFSNRRITDAWLNIRNLYWPITSDTAHQYALGDGGSIDNSGLLPLLQRRARKVIWIATSYMPMTEYDYEKATFGSFDPHEAQVVDQVAAAFGYGLNDKDEGYFYSKNQVFNKSELLPICRKLWNLKSQGKPCVLKETLEVLPNNYWGIVGGYEVSLVLVYLDQCTDFQKQLPEEVQQEIAKGASGETTRNNKDDSLGLTTAQVNLLAAQGEYAVRQNAELFREFAGRDLPLPTYHKDAK
eukprot:s1902_g2.t1